jgi:outer membrane protein OmpA-like peptidoglycan-associated protein
MKINNKSLIVLMFLSFFISMPVHSQSLKLRKANKYFESFSYDKAIKLYEEIEDKTPGVYRNLAKSYLMLGNTEKAEQYYNELMGAGQYKPIDVYDYAGVLMMNKKYDEAANWMEKYYKLRPDDRRAQAFMANPLYYRDLLKSDPQMVLNDLDVNTAYSDFSPVYYQDNQVVFASSRGDSRLINRRWNGNEQPFVKLYQADLTAGGNLTNVQEFTDVINKEYHDGPATFNADGDYMIVTRNIYDKSGLQDNKLWLYESHLIDGEYWEDPQPLYFNDTKFSSGQASLSPDGTVMYFASDRPGGFGGTDIYRSYKGKDGRWSEPENLGDKINSEGNEMFPYYDARGGYLFFSSNGWPGLGGLDIFVSKVRSDGSFTPVQNMGAPINSNRDDFSFIYNEKGHGFLSSNRYGGQGDDDIYSFNNMPAFKDKIEDCSLSGVVRDKDTHEPLGFAKVIMLDDKGNKLKEVETRLDGRYDLPIDCGNVYDLYVLREGYYDAKAHIDSKTFESSKIVKDFDMVRPQTKVEDDLCKVKIAPIYYDLDKFYIRYKDKVRLDKIVSLMKKYPTMVLEVSSYTDSRASKPYNVKLSKNRTMSVINYLTKEGISKDRLVAKWFGELYPVNACVDGVPCSEEEYQQNRRTEFKILNCE